MNQFITTESYYKVLPVPGGWTKMFVVTIIQCIRTENFKLLVIRTWGKHITLARTVSTWRYSTVCIAFHQFSLGWNLWTINFRGWFKLSFISHLKLHQKKIKIPYEFHPSQIKKIKKTKRKFLNHQFGLEWFIMRGRVVGVGWLGRARISTQPSDQYQNGLV